MGGARWDDWRTGCPLPTAGAALRPMCQLAWRSGCSAADRTITSSGGPAAGVPPSAATGATAEPLRAAQGPRLSAARLRAWRVTGVAIWPAPHRAERSAAQRSDLQAGQFAKRASFTRSVKETGPAPPGTGRAAAWFSRQRRPDCVASGMEARQGRDTGTPVARREARQPGPAQRGDAQAHRDLAPAAPSPQLPKHSPPHRSPPRLYRAEPTLLAVS